MSTMQPDVAMLYNTKKNKDRKMRRFSKDNAVLTLIDLKAGFRSMRR